MAAVEPLEYTKKQNSSPNRKELSDTADPEHSENILQEKNESSPPNASDEPQKTNATTNGAAYTSLSKVGVQPGEETDSTTCNLSEKHEPEAEKEACPNTVCGSELHSLDWSETDDYSEETQANKLNKSHKQELSVVTGSSEEGQNNSTKLNTEAGKAQSNNKDESILQKESTENNASVIKNKETDGKEAEEADKDKDVEPSTKPKKRRMVCKECGKIFNRRETFNLHKHFHLHEDELKPLTCKECGLTFQQRSSFIKHRKEHKAKEEKPLSSKRGVRKKEGVTFECAECAAVFFTVDKLRAHKCSYTDEIFYHCPLCRQEFKYKSSVTKHMLSHSQEGFQCPECDQTFPDQTSLRVHQHSHAALKPYECPECGMVFKHFSVMADHRRKHTEGSGQHLCTICGKSFKYSSLLHQHEYLHTGQKAFRCSECGKTFAFAQNLKAHCRQHSLQKAQVLSTTERLKNPLSVSGQTTIKKMEKENTHQSKDAVRTFKCPLCPQTYTTAANLRAHIQTHEAEYEMLDRKSPKDLINWDKGHTCPHCPSVYRDESSLNMHVSRVHTSVAPKVDNRTIDSPKTITHPSHDDIQENIKIDDKVKSFKCPECGKTFRHRSVLELHMRIHSKDKPYQCKVCGKGFRFSSYLQQHLIIHTGKKPYKCQDCGKDFAFLQNMRTHQKLHQEKPFRCTSCRKGYSNEAELHQHMLSHNGDKPHKCNQCDKSFGLAYLLRDHMNTHTGDRPHRCEECNKTFTWLSSLLVHQKTHSHKNRSFSQYNLFPMGTRTRGRGTRGRPPLSLSRTFARSEISRSFNSDTPREGELQRNSDRPPHVHVGGLDLAGRQQNEPVCELLPPQLQWKADGGEVMPLPPIQQADTAPQPFDNLLQSPPPITHAVQASNIMENTHSLFGPGPTAVPKKSSPTLVSEIEPHRQQKSITWSSPSSSLHTEFIPSGTYIDEAALWSVRPAALHSSSKNLGPTWQGGPVPHQKDLSTLKKDEGRPWDLNNTQVPTVIQPEKPWISSLPSSSTTVHIDQTITSMPSHRIGPIWDIQAPPGIQNTLNSPDRLVSNAELQLQQKQVSSSWVGIPSQPTSQKVPISIQYEAHRFGQGIGAPLWGLQSNPVGPQAMLPGQLKSANVQELQQQQSMVTGTKLIINQSSPFFSPPLAPLPPIALPASHPLHSVAVGAIPRPPPPNIFFPPPAVSQTLSLPQLTPQTEPHKLGPHLSFSPDRLHQCMICGCSLPREVDLQMHYLQHAQGEI